MGNEQKSNLAVIKKGFLSEAAVQHFKDAIPNATGEQALATAKRFAKMCLTAIQQNPTLQKCSFASLLKAASISASLDLDIDPRGLAYLVPYKGEANFQIGYKGLIDLAYRSGKVKAISAHCIYESERGSVTISRVNGQFEIEHPFDMDKSPTGKMIAVYATAEVEGCGTQSTVLRFDEVERFRKLSKAPNSPAWKSFPDAMAKKTAIRQLAKFLPQSILPEFQRAAAIDERETFEQSSQNAQTTIQSEQGSEAVEAAFEPQTTTGTEVEGDVPEFMQE